MIYKLIMPDDCEGRTTHIVGFFVNRLDAQSVGQAGIGNKLMGPSVGRVEEVKVYNDLTEFVGDNLNKAASEASRQKLLSLLDGPARTEALRRSALAKLSIDEKIALGVS